MPVNQSLVKLLSFFSRSLNVGQSTTPPQQPLRTIGWSQVKTFSHLPCFLPTSSCPCFPALFILPNKRKPFFPKPQGLLQSSESEITLLLVLPPTSPITIVPFSHLQCTFPIKAFRIQSGLQILRPHPKPSKRERRAGKAWVGAGCAQKSISEQVFKEQSENH